MKLIFVGAQASGKGTQAKIISQNLKIAHISTGDLLRNSSGQLKKELDESMNSGKLVPDELMLRILKERLSRSDCKSGFILDGFPRNMEQAKALDKITKIDKVIEIEISDKEAINRLVGRRNCPQCGKIYNINTAPKPAHDNLCDDCSVQLNQRADDALDAIKKRLETYHNETEPILKHYKSIKVNGEQDIDSVTKDILNALQ
jgi:adenylate kinase